MASHHKRGKPRQRSGGLTDLVYIGPDGTSAVRARDQLKDFVSKSGKRHQDPEKTQHGDDEEADLLMRSAW